MRSASSYRGAKKAEARKKGQKFSTFNENFTRRRIAAAESLQNKALRLTPEQARAALGVWAANGGRKTVAEAPVTEEALKAINETAQKITMEDVDRALEAALTKHQTQSDYPLPLKPNFAARARALGWVEGVEYTEIRE